MAYLEKSAAAELAGLKELEEALKRERATLRRVTGVSVRSWQSGVIGSRRDITRLWQAIGEQRHNKEITIRVDRLSIRFVPVVADSL